MSGGFEIIVHRGHNLTRGENSLAGVEEIRALATDFMIEVDVCVTADDVPILYHDLTLDRLCGDPRLVGETVFAALPRRNDGEEIARLADLLDAYPDQRFMFDLRTHVHEDFLRDSGVSADRLRPTLKRIVDAVGGLLPRRNRAGSRLVTGNPAHRKVLMRAFPDYEVDIPEQFTRDYLRRLPDLADTSLLGPDVRRMYIRFREIVPEVVAWAHRMGLRIIANHAPSRRSLENSRMMLERSLAWGLDGLTASPIDAAFIAAWRDAGGNGSGDGELARGKASRGNA